MEMFDFEDVSKELPINRKLLAKRTTELAAEIRDEYVGGLQINVRNLNEKSNLFLTGPALCKYLLKV